MKFVGIVGSNAEVSYNRLLLEFIKKNYTGLFELDVVEIKDIPMFNQSNDQTSSAPIQLLNQKILAADGVIIATPEHNHTIPASLKSVLEWLSFTIHPLVKKPVMIIGASYYDQGSSRAQLHLRQILDAPGVDAIVMPGNEFLLGKVKEAFDENDQLKDQNTANFLYSILEKFVAFVSLVNRLEAPKEVPLPEEDLYATYPIETTIEGVDMAAEDWVEQAAVKSDAVEGDTYVKLNRGILTVNQINTFLMSMPMELTYADENNQFLYYNYTKDADMLAGRVPGQVGNPLVLCHPERALKNAAWVIQQLRSGRQDVVRIHVPTHGPDKFVVHNYQAMHDEEGAYKGVNEYILDFKPIVDWYLKQTGLTLEGDIDATTGASQEEETAEVNEEEKEKVAVDAGSGASIKS